MKVQIAFPPQTVYFIGYSDLDNIHYDIINPDQILTTERDVVEEYANYEAWANRLLELGINLEEINNPQINLENS